MNLKINNFERLTKIQTIRHFRAKMGEFYYKKTDLEILKINHEEEVEIDFITEIEILLNKVIADSENAIFDAVLLSTLEYKVFLSHETFRASAGNLPTSRKLCPAPVEHSPPCIGSDKSTLWNSVTGWHTFRRSSADSRRS